MEYADVGNIQYNHSGMLYNRKRQLCVAQRQDKDSSQSLHDSLHGTALWSVYKLGIGKKGNDAINEII